MFYAANSTPPNINLETGIRFGVISGRSLNSEVFNDLFHNCGTNLSQEEAYEELKKSVEADADNIEDECRIAVEEVGYGTEDEYERLLEVNIEAAYEGLGFSCREDYVDTRCERECEFLEIEEPIIEGNDDGVSYRISWLGGAPLVWVFKSPFTRKVALCSPCVPNAGNLDSPDDDGYVAYDVPTHWRDNETD